MWRWTAMVSLCWLFKVTADEKKTKFLVLRKERDPEMKGDEHHIGSRLYTNIAEIDSKCSTW